MRARGRVCVCACMVAHALGRKPLTHVSSVHCTTPAGTTMTNQALQQQRTAAHNQVARTGPVTEALAPASGTALPTTTTGRGPPPGA